MRKFISIVVFIILSLSTLNATDKVFTRIDLDDIDAGGVDSRANMGTFYNSEKFYVFYPGFYDGYTQRIKVRHLKLLPGGKIEKHGMADINDIRFPAACTMFDGKLFIVAQKNESNSEGHLTLRAYDGDWSNLKSHNFSSGVKTHCGVALVELNNKLFCFYKYTDGSLRLITSEDGFSWSSHIEIESNWLSHSHGTISACTFIDNDKISKIMLAFTNKDNSIIYFKVIHEDGSKGREFHHDKSVNNISMIQGSAHGGTHGNVIQMFYSSWHNDHRIYRFDYSISNNSFSGTEELTWSGGNSEMLGDKDTFTPGTLIEFINDNEFNRQKYLICFISRFYHDNDNNYIRDMRIYSWKSDKLVFNRDDQVVTDYDPSPKLCKLIGVIEGPPPYTSNKYEFGEWGSQGYFPPSSLEYGTQSSSSTENSSNIGSSINADVKISRFGGGFDYEIENTNSHSETRTITNNVRVEITKTNGIGYRVFSKPIIQRRKYKLHDWKDNDLGININLFKFKGPYIVYEPYELTDVNPDSIRSYLNRSIDFDSYDKFINLDFEWSLGASYGNSVSLTKTEEHKSTSGTEISIGLDSEFGEIFKIESEYGHKIEYSISTTTSMKKEFTLSFNCPAHADSVDHIKYFRGEFYWLKPTKEKDNWWIPDGYEKDEPWLMTYNLKKISKNLGGVILDIDEDEQNKLFSIYPNPAKDNVSIISNDAINSDIKVIITDVLNNNIIEFDNRDTKDNSIPWDLKNTNGSKVPQGTYFISIYNGTKVFTEKLIIIK